MHLLYMKRASSGFDEALSSFPDDAVALLLQEIWYFIKEYVKAKW